MRSGASWALNLRRLNMNDSIISDKEKQRRINMKTIALKHGMSKGRSEYNSWLNMKQRCKNINNPRFKDWGGKGVSVCERWENSFENFLLDMGEKPNNCTSIDRINGKGNYEPGNCRWADSTSQSENRPGFVRSIKYEGNNYTISGLARKFNLNREMLKYRINNGWKLDDAVNIPSKRKI